MVDSEKKEYRHVEGFMTWAMSRGLLVSHNFVIIYPQSGTSDINLMVLGHSVTVYFHIYTKYRYNLYKGLTDDDNDKD